MSLNDPREPACRAENPELFFPTSAASPKRIDEAKAVCLRCPRLDPCLAYALRNNVEGVWGATSYKERQRMRRELKIVAEPISFGGLVKRGNAPGAHPGGTPVGVETHRKRYEPLCDACAEFVEAKAS